jgi:hypothetical protein
MKPDDDNGKRTLIIEQWWVGFGLLLFWGGVIMLYCAKCSTP